jgi:EAL domain-containing protein (putative c-di-GMP-specific phosphodiesterase class I)/CheY-like chemotaxis protein/GGDEF domain-containing protein
MNAPDRGMPSALVADDDEINLILLREALEGAGFRVTTVGNGADALREGHTGQYDIALLDVAMPKLDGYAVCRALRAAPATSHLPIIMITSRDDSLSVDRAYEAGATDFIAKPVNWHLIPHRLRYVLRSAESEARIRELAYFDPQTGLPNRQSAVRLIGEALDATHRAGENHGAALMVMELPGVGHISETFGSHIGIGALQGIARRLPPFLQSMMLARARVDCARTADAELLVCVTGGTPQLLAEELTLAIKRWFQEPVAVFEHEFFLEPFIGIALAPEHGNDPETLLMHAATALDVARRGNLMNHTLYNEAMSANARERIALDVELRHAVRNEELVLHFQPKIRLCDGALCGVEALLRWIHPERGPISPGVFIPLAEESGLILEIDDWVVRTACRQLYNWREAGFSTNIAINFSGKHFLYGDPVSTILRETEAAKVSPADLTVEITESVLMRDSGPAQACLRRLRELGCKVSIDDFGTGYSSLAYLKTFPADAIKVDRAFVQQVDTQPGAAAIFAAILGLARSLGLSVTAEGVETEGQLAWLTRMECDDVQGYLLGKAQSGYDIAQQYKSRDTVLRSDVVRA